MFGVGSNYFGQLGVQRDTPSNVPVPLSLVAEEDEQQQQLRDVQCGGQFTVALTQQGHLYLSGTMHGVVFPAPQRVELQLPIRATQVACGRKHILALLEGGFVVSWGTGYFGQLGHDDDASLHSPKMITDLEPRVLGAQVVKVACGGSHSAALTDTGRLFMWGLNKNGQCGVNVKQDSLVRPCPTSTSNLLPDEQIKDVVCGRNHSGLITNRHNVYTWGGSSYGRLGLLDIRKAAIPSLVQELASLTITRIASGDMHMLALTQEGEVYSWGYNGEGQCGHGNVLHLRTPRRIERLRRTQIEDIACGSTWSLAIASKGVLYAWGYGDGGWLGLQLSQGELDNLPIVDPDLPNNRTAHGCSRSFESRLNVLLPERVRFFHSEKVIGVRAGGGHTIIIVDDSVSAGDRPSSQSESSSGEGRLSYDWTVPEDVDKIMSLCRHNRQEALQELLDSGLPIDIRDAHGNTPLLIACQNGHQELVRLLLQRGADINATNEGGNSCLHYVFAYGFYELGDWLIVQGADQYVTNKEGLTCFEGLTMSDLEQF